MMITGTSFLLISTLLCSLTVTGQERPSPRPEAGNADAGDGVSDSVERKTSGAAEPDTLNVPGLPDVEMSSRGGVRVEVCLDDGSMMYGDLVSIRENVLSVYVYRDFSYAYSHGVKSGIHDFDLRKIQKVVVKGRSKVLQGIFMGFLGGMVAGAVMTRIVERKTSADQLFGPGAFGGIGLVAGGVAGYLNSGIDLEITNFGDKELILLNALSRHPRAPSH